jgi:hypothetical protein
MSKFDIGAIFRLRYSRSKLSKTEDMAKRNSDLTRAAQKDDKKCVMDVESKSICLLAYCMLFDINWSSMRRSWARMVNGDQVQDVGRPKGSSGSSATSARSHDAYAWLKRWIEIFGDLDPVGQKFKYVVNYILPADLHEEYSRDFAFSGMARNIFPLSQRSFIRVWSLFIHQERVRVRRKANTTTKCRGKDTKNYSPRVFLGHKLHSSSVWSLCAVCDELLVRSKDPKSNREELARVREARIVHHKDIMELRQLYVDDTQRAKHDFRFQTIAFDGTNSNTCNCPQDWRSSVRGEAVEGTFVPQKIQSVLIHGRALVFYVVPPFVKSGMDLTVSCLIDAMQYVDPRTRVIRFQYDGRP